MTRGWRRSEAADEANERVRERQERRSHRMTVVGIIGAGAAAVGFIPEIPILVRLLAVIVFAVTFFWIIFLALLQFWSAAKRFWIIYSDGRRYKKEHLHHAHDAARSDHRNAFEHDQSGQADPPT